MRLYLPALSPSRLLIFSLSLVFIWFGALKFFGISPVNQIIGEAYPWITENRIWYFGLAIFEIGIGVGLLVPGSRRLSAWIMAAHLLFATFGVLFSPQAFAENFPFLSLAGEFVVKNFVLVAGALVVARG